MRYFADNVVRCLVAASLLLSLLPAVPAAAAPAAYPGRQDETATVTPEPTAPETPPPAAETEEPPATDTPVPTDTVTASPAEPTSAPPAAETGTLPPEETAVPLETATAPPPPAETATPAPTATDMPGPVPASTFTPEPEATLRSSAGEEPGWQVYLPLVWKAALPQAEFTSPRLTGPAPLSVTFANSSTHATRLVWDFGDGSAPLVVSASEEMLATSAAEEPLLGPTHVYTQAGVYTVTLQAGNGVITDTFTQANYITPFQLNVPQAGFAGTPLAASRPLTVTFDNLSSGASEYVWDFGDTLTSTAISPSHAYTRTGVYTVSLTARAGALSDVLTRTAYITVSEAIAAGFTAEPLRGRAPLTVTLSNLLTNATAYTWDFGDGATSTELSPSHVYTRPGVYSVTLVAGDGVVSDTLVQPAYITVAEAITAGFSAFPLAGPAPLTVQFLDGSIGAESYLWDFGDTGAEAMTGSLPSPTHTYTLPGVYTVTLTVADGVTEAAQTKPGYVTVLEPVVPGFWAEPVTGTVPLTVTFHNSSTGATDYAWEFGTGATLTAISPTYTYRDPGVYTVTLTAIGPGGRETLVQSHCITAYAPITADFSADVLAGTVPLTITFSNNSINATVYTWDFGDDSGGSVIISPTHIYTRPGVYTVTLMATDGTLTDTLTRPAYINLVEPVVANYWAEPVTGTVPLTITFRNNSTNATGYLWDFDDGSPISTEVSPTHIYTQPGVYTVTLVAGNRLVTDTLTRTGYITASGQVLADFSANVLAGTAPLTVTFANSSSQASVYHWDFGDGSAGSDETNPTHVYSQLGVYTVTLAASDRGLTNTLVKAGYVEVVEPGAPGAGLPVPSAGGLLFIENAGQFDPNARFMVRGSLGSLYLADDALWFTVLESLPEEDQKPGKKEKLPHERATQPRRGVNFKVSFPGANPHARIEPFNRLETAVSYFIGSDPGEWRPDVPVWGGVRYVDFYPGVDLEISSQDGELVQRLMVRQMPDVLAGRAGEGWGRGVRMRLEGTEGLALERGRALRLSTAIGDFSLPLLQAVDADGRPLDLALASPQVTGDEISAPFAPASTASAPAIVTRRVSGLASPLPLGLLSPLAAGASDLIYSTFLGGSDGDQGNGIALDSSRNAYVTGVTSSANFTTTTGVFDRDLSGWVDAFVIKLNSSGTGLVYSAFLGGSYYDYGYGIAVDGSGNAYVTGYTRSSDFPMVNAYRASYSGESEAFVTKVNSTGTALVYSTFLGGNCSLDDIGHGIAVNGSGNAYVTGYTSCSDFPTTTGAYDRSLDDFTELDTFVTKLNSGGSSLAYSTFLGGSNYEFGYDIAVDGSGNAYVIGETHSTDFPTVNAYDNTFDGNDAFVTKVNNSGSALAYSTFLGGGSTEYGYGIAVDASGNAYVTGETYSADFPTTTGAYGRSLAGVMDTFVTKLNSGGSSLAYSTFLGGSNYDSGYDIAVDGSGNAYVTGYTRSSDFPLTANAYDISLGGSLDAFVTKVNNSGSGLAYSTFLEGSSYEQLNGDIAVDGSGNAYVTGFTRSSNFPTTTGAYDTSLGGSQDGFVTKLALGTHLTITKAGPAMAVVRKEITYTLTITNLGNTAATGLVITDAIPSGAVYIRGGTQVGSVVSWTLASLAAGATANFNFVVTATQTITNSSYRVSAAGGASAAGTKSVVTSVYPQAAANFSATPRTGTAPLTVAFTNSSSGATGYLWRFGTGATSTAVNPVYTYTQSGVYTINLTASNPGGSHTFTRTSYITVYQPVTAGFTASPLTGTIPLTVAFTNQSSGATGYLWQFGMGAISTAVNPVYTYTQSGVYTVSLAATGPGGSHVLTHTNYITVADASIEGLLAINDSPTLLGETTTFTATISAGSNISYDWAFGDGVIGSGAVITHTYPQAGYYTAVVTASNPVSVVTATTTVTITGAADLAIAKMAPAWAVAGEPVTYTLLITNSGAGPAANLLITDTLPISAHHVSGGDLAGGVISWTVPSLAGGEAISVTFTVTAATTITNSDYAVTAEGGVSAVGQEIVTTEVYPPVIPDFIASPLAGVAPLAVTFSNSSTNATEYVWAYGDGITSTTTAPTHVHTYTQAGVYTVTLIAGDGDTTDTLTRPNYITVTPPASFPTTGILDDFNRANGTIGGNWSGMTTGFSLVSNRLDVNSGENYIYWNPASFGADQEAYVSLAQVDQSGTSVNLLLKFRPDGSGVIGVAYDPAGQRVQVWTYTAAQDWVQRGADIPVTLANGDQLGARATADGQVEVYRNGVLLASRDVTAWPYYADGGYIGLWSVNSAATVLDDFGGGTAIIPAAPVAAFSASPLAGVAPLAVTFSNSSTNATEYVWAYGDGITSTTTAPTHIYTYTQAGVYTVTLTASDGITGHTQTRPNYITVTPPASFPTTGILDDFNRANGTIGGNWSGMTTGFSLVNQQLDVNSGQNYIYWNPASFGADQEAYVSLAQIDQGGTSVNLLLKFRPDGSGVIQVAYNPAGQRVQVRTYTPAQDWVQRGADIPVTLANGDQLGARATADGQVEVYRNGVLLASRDVTAWPYYADAGYIGLLSINSAAAVLDDFGGGTVVETQAPVAAFLADPVAGPAPLVVTFSNSSTNATEYIWAYGDGITSTTTATSHVYTYTQAGIYTVTLTASNGITNHTQTRPAYITVTTSTPIQGLVAINDSPTVLGQTTTFTTTISDGSNVSYDWAFGDGQSDSGAVVTHTYPQAGTYTAVVTASNPASVVTATTAVTITGSADLAISKTAPSTAVAGEPVTYTLTITNSGTGPAANLLITDTLPINSYYVSGGDLAGDVVSWTVPALADGEAISVTFTVTAATTITNSDYAVTADGDISAVGQEAVTTLVYPAPDFSAEPLSGTVPLTVTFTNSTIGASAYLWDYGNGITSTITATIHVYTYTQAGVYTVTLTATGPGGSDTLTRTGYISVTDTSIEGLAALNDSPTILGETTTLTATISAGSNVSYDWAFGDGQSGSGAVVTHTYSQAGAYTAVVTASNPASVVTATTAVTITGAAGLAISKTAPSTAVAGEPVTYTLTITNSGAGPAANLLITDTLPISAHYVSGGTLVGENVVSWTIPSLAGGEAISVTFTVTAAKTITNSDYAVAADGGIFTAGQEAVTTQVSPLTIDKTAPAMVVTGDLITYTLTITNLDSTPATHLLITDTLPISAHYLSGGDLTGGVISWTVPSLDGGETISVTFTVTAATTITNSNYALAADGGLYSIGQKAVTTLVYELPVADFSASPLTGTIPLTVTFSNSSSNATSYVWDFGDSITSTLISPTHTYTRTGVYTVTLAAGNGVITSAVTRTHYITAFEPLNIDFYATPLTGTAPLTVTFTNNSSGATSYLWGFGDSITSTVVSPTHIYTVPGVYTVTLAITGTEETKALTRPAYIEVFGADFTAEPQIGPAPLAVTFTDILSDRVESRLWDFGDGITETTTAGISTTHVYTRAGVYTPILVVVREGHTYTETKTAYIAARGAEFQAAPPSGLSPLSVTFTDLVSAPVTYRSWDFGDGSAPWITTGLTGTTASITATHLYTQTGVYSVTLVVERDGYTYTHTTPELILVSQPACGITTTHTTWWDGRFFYRQPVTLTVAGQLDYTPGITHVIALTLDTESLITDSLMLPGGEDLRIVYHDATGWRDLPRHIEGLNSANTTVYFPLQATIAVTDTGYYLYYGHVAPGEPLELYQPIESAPTITTSGSGTFTPTVAFTASIYAGLAPLNVTFTNLTTPTSGVTDYSWSFGDGGTSSAISPGYTYDDPGVYTIGLTAQTTEGLEVAGTWPGAIQVPGLDATGEAIASLGARETPVVTATICVLPVPQSFTSADGRLTITFPPGAVQEQIFVTHTPQRLPGFGPEVLSLYGLSATTLAGVPVSTFDKEIDLALQYDDTALPEWLEGSIAGFAWNETTETWDYLSTAIDSTSNLATMHSNHISSLQMAMLSGIGSAQLGTPEDSSETPGAVSAAQSDLFSGAATWSYPLHVAPGRNGLQPSLALSYNSHLVETKQTDFQKSGWLGLGFDLEPGFIEMEMYYGTFEEYLGPCPDGSGNMCPRTAPTDFEAYLTLNGARTRLIGIDGDDDDDLTDLFPGTNPVASFRLQQENFLRVELWQNGPAQNDNVTDLTLVRNNQPLHLHNLYWKVTTKEGTVYRFGYASKSAEVRLAVIHEPVTLNALAFTSYPGRAYLDEITDLYGNKVTFTYGSLARTGTLYDNPSGWGLFPSKIDSKFYHQYVRLERIDYTYQGDNPTRQVSFSYKSRTDEETPPPPAVLEQGGKPVRYYPYLLDAVAMSVDGDEFLRYELTYDHVTYDPRLFWWAENVPVLASIQVIGDGQPLAAQTDLDYYRDEWLGYYKGLLHHIDNGYGGRTSFTYDADGSFKRVSKIETKDIWDGEPVARTFSVEKGYWGERHIWIRNGVTETDSQGENVTHYVFHKPFDFNPFDTNLPPLTGQLDRVEVYDTAKIVRDTIPVGPPLQSTCYEYYINERQESAFVAPKKVTTAYGNCEAGGIVVEYEYDEYGNLTTTIERGGDAGDRYLKTEYITNTTHWVVNRPDRSLITAADGKVEAETDYGYEFRDGSPVVPEKITTTQVDHVDETNLVTSSHYDPYGNIDWVEDGKGQRTSVIYDSSHTFPEETTYPQEVGGQPLKIHTTYDPNWGTLKTVTGFNGESTTYQYDPFGRLERVTDPVATTVQNYSDNTTGLQVHITYASGSGDSYQTWSEYNGLGQLDQAKTQGEDGDVIKVDYRYDPMGRLWKTSVPYTGTTASLWTETLYDPLGRPETVINPDSTRQSFVYDGWQQVTATLSRDGFERQTVYQRDRFGRTREVEQYKNEAAVTTGYGYDLLGNLTYISDDAGNETHSIYDSLGRQREVTDPDMGQWVYTYDANSNLYTQTDARGQVITYTYDALNRLENKQYSDGTPPVAYTYDEGLYGLGRRTGMSDESGSTTWQYDIAGRLISETKTIDAQTYTTGYTYDAMSRVKQMTYPDGEVVTYGYNNSGQVNSLTSSNGATYLQAAQYSALGQPTTLSLAGGNLNTTFSYYPSGNHALALQGITTQNQSGSLLDLSYPEYDPLGSLKVLSATLPVNLDLSYTYNDLGWLEGVTDNLDDGMDHSFQYSSVGNLIHKDGMTLDYTSGESNLAHAPGFIQLPGDESSINFIYDDNGNRIERLSAEGDLIYTYDAENRLAQVADDLAPLVTYTYDGDHQRVQRTSEGKTTYTVGSHYEVVQQDGWSDHAAIFGGETGTQQQFDSHLVASDDGTLYLVWIENDNSDPYNMFAEIRFASRAPGAGWYAPEVIRELPSSSFSHLENINPLVAVVTATNEIYVAWQEYDAADGLYDLHISRRGGGWDDIVIDSYSSDDHHRPALAASSAGAVYLAWSRPDVEDENVHVAVSPNWNEIYTTASLGNSLDQNWPELVTDSRGVYLGYIEMDSNETHSLYILHYETGGSWGLPELVGEVPSPSQLERPVALAVDNLDNLFAAWLADTNLYLRKRMASTGTWEPVQDGTENTLDEEVDLTVRDGIPYWFSAAPHDSSSYNVWSNDLLVVEEGELNHVVGLNIVAGPDNTLVAIWEAAISKNPPTRLYISTYNPDPSSVKHYYAGGQRIASRVNDSLYYFLGDHLGSTTVVADADGNKVGHVVYDPYGEVLENTLPPGLTDRLFTGYRWDDTIGLYDAKARFYDPELGQFTQPDSLVPEPYHPISLNRYAYTYNSPVNFTDSSGHFIDTLWDAFDLGANLRNCLGNTDSLSCYMVPLAAAFLTIPGLTKGGAGSAAHFRQVRYGGRNLSRFAQEYRLTEDFWGQSNVAVFKVSVSNTLDNASIPYFFKEERNNIRLLVTNAEGRHAERRIGEEVIELQARGIGIEVLEIYSELHPCPSLPGFQYCAQFIMENFVRDRGLNPKNVSYSFQYGVSDYSREAGRKAWRKALRQLRIEGQVGQDDLFDRLGGFFGR